LTSVPLDFDFSTLYALYLPNDSRPHGFLIPATVEKMPWSPEFLVQHDKRTIHLADSSNGAHTATSCNESFQKVIDEAISADIFPSVHAKHSELLKIMGANQFIHLERFTAPLWGIAGQGAHLTAYVNTPSGLKVWVPRRAANLFTYPNMLDTTVAGGVKSDDSPFQCILAESDEEASLPADFVKKNARATGVITYVAEGRATRLISSTVLYVFDLELPETMIPSPKDGEVAGFELMSIEEINAAMFQQEFKPNCTLVMIDFFMRHGIITPDNEEDYVEIATRLRRKLPVPTTPAR
jgi:8-oxo-dGTP pyrophosphatase MutT (NUDIX family)